jgi:predicted hotdog family 3-hydroxylacyl-ACP dehydratase
VRGPFPPIDELLPHTPPMLLLDALVELDDERATSVARITERSMFLTNGRVPAVLTIEHMAQTAAAFAGAGRRRRGLPPQIGVLMECPSMTLAVEWLAPGDELSIEAHRVWSSEILAHFDCLVRRAGEPIAEATLHFYLGPPPKAREA